MERKINAETRNLMIKKAFNMLYVMPIVKLGAARFSMDNVQRVLTVTKELHETFGHAFSDADTALLMKTPKSSLDKIIEQFMNYQEVYETGNLLFPGYPEQVINMSDEEFYVKQMIHYCSSFLAELDIIPEEYVYRDQDSTDGERIQDINLLNDKIIKLVDDDELEFYCYSFLMHKKERLTPDELDLIKWTLESGNIELVSLAGVQVTFKENLIPVFKTVMDSPIHNSVKSAILRSLCQHTGDVYKAVRPYIDGTEKGSLPTSQRRLLVKLIESYPVADFRANAWPSIRLSADVERILRNISFTKFARSERHLQVVEDMKCGKLKSWEALFKAKLATRAKRGGITVKANLVDINKLTYEELMELARAKQIAPDEGEEDIEILKFLAQRPGLMIRWCAWMLREGFSKEDISSVLSTVVDKISGVTVYGLVNQFMCNKQHREDAADLEEIFKGALKGYLASNPACEVFNNKKLFFKDGLLTIPEIGNDTQEGRASSYIKNGLVYPLPIGAGVVRAYTFWTSHSDQDLHATMRMQDGTIRHVGWNADRQDSGVCFSGDMVRAPGAEFIDIDLAKAKKAGVKYINIMLHNFSGQTFSYEYNAMGVMALSASSFGQRQMALYSKKNVFFEHALSDMRYQFERNQYLFYALIDLEKDTIAYVGDPNIGYDEWNNTPDYSSMLDSVYRTGKALDNIALERPKQFSCADILEYIVETHNCEVVGSADEADLVVTLGHPATDKEISIVDKYYWLQ